MLLMGIWVFPSSYISAGGGGETDDVSEAESEVDPADEDVDTSYYAYKFDAEHYVKHFKTIFESLWSEQHSRPIHCLPIRQCIR